MRARVIADAAHDRKEFVHYDTQTFLNLQTRGYWEIAETKVFDERVVLMTDFRDPSDEPNLWGRVGVDG